MIGPSETRAKELGAAAQEAVLVLAGVDHEILLSLVTKVAELKGFAEATGFILDTLNADEDR
jgi:hypothetical protein